MIFAKDLPIGAKVVDKGITYNGAPLPFRVLSKSPENVISLISDYVIESFSYDAKEPGNPDALNGNPRYLYSNLMQWLNASGTGWYKPQHDLDRPPSYASRPGFLTGFSENVKLCTDGGKGGTNDASRYFKVQLPVGGTNYEYFKERGSRIGYNSSGTAVDYWLRQWSTSRPATYYPASGDSDEIEGQPYEVRGVWPIIHLDKNTAFEKNSDETYSLYTGPDLPIINEIIGGIQDLGVFREPFSLSYRTVLLNSCTWFFTYDGNWSKEPWMQSGMKEFSPDPFYWNPLTIGKHTLDIRICEGFTYNWKENVLIELSITFTKQADSLEVLLAEPFETAEPVCRAALCVSGQWDEGAAFSAEVCNNAFDIFPTWEEVTEKVLAGEMLDLQNRTKTAEKWGYDFRIKIVRGDTTGDCYITLIKSNFK